MPTLNLKQILALDAISCLVMFLLCLFATSLISSLTGLPAIVLTVAGWILLASAAIMATVALQAPARAAGVQLIVLGNLLWVAASVLLAFFFWPQLTPLGVIIIAAQAAAVLLFAWGEAKGAARLSAVSPA
ncbi:hypothetical protein [Sphingopyxis sp. MWB1]|uniref:hypothetical protein n=1 Tax=Sphingopyxis sp. MWB1 TaxID=1537715 RepID=UPI00051A1646|nr:hypothetical protein [Sphingopyxis sp. MWB1]